MNENPTTERAHSSAVAVERAADILFFVASHGDATLTDLARHVGSSGSAVHRILTALKRKGLIEQQEENGPYSLSWSILGLTHRLMADSDIRTVSLPFMTQLRDMTLETVTINVRSGFHRVCIDQLESPQEVRWRQEVGRISPLYAGPTGKVILAHFSDDELDEYFRVMRLEKLTSYTTVDQAEIRRELAEVREKGYAIALQDRVVGVAGTSAPIFDETGTAVGALAVSGPSERCTVEKLQEWSGQVAEAASMISEFLWMKAPTAGSSHTTDNGSQPATSKDGSERVAVAAASHAKARSR